MSETMTPRPKRSTGEFLSATPDFKWAGFYRKHREMCFSIIESNSKPSTRSNNKLWTLLMQPDGLTQAGPACRS